MVRGSDYYNTPVNLDSAAAVQISVHVPGTGTG